MIRPLRNFHYAVWRVLIVVLPVVFCLALLFHRQYQPETFHDDDFAISYTKAGATTILEIDVLNPIKYPSCLVYGSTKDGEVLLGQLSKRGQYRFALNNRITSVTLLDQIRSRRILRKTLSPKEGSEK